ncbi:MAG: hypothetical protein WCQ21_05310 [Verrucomicrobiota bacterium]|jgi:hypothetical protein
MWTASPDFVAMCCVRVPFGVAMPAVNETTLQGDSGGWITDHDAKGKRIGEANVETTCLCIFCLEAFTVRKESQGN